jgi:integral membrane sensor domain MASE1
LLWIALVAAGTAGGIGVVNLWLAPVPGRSCLTRCLRLCSACWSGGWLSRRDESLRPGTVRHGFQVLLAGTGHGPSQAGVIGGYGLWHAHIARAAVAGRDATALVLGELLGVASVTPALLLAAQWWHRRHARRVLHPGGIGEGLLWNVALIASFLLMAWGMSVSRNFTLGLTSLPLTVMLWSALRFTPLRTAVSVLLTVGLITALSPALGLAGFQSTEGTLEVAILLVYLCLLAILPTRAGDDGGCASRGRRAA